MITQIGKKRVLIKACPTHVTKRLERGEKVTFTLLTALWFFQNLAGIRRPEQVKLKIRKDGEKKLCSRPDCDGEVHGKSVTVYDILYPICSCCSVAAYVAANKWGGPWPQDEARAQEEREETNEGARAMLLKKLGLGQKGQLVAPIAVLAEVNDHKAEVTEPDRYAIPDTFGASQLNLVDDYGLDAAVLDQARMAAYFSRPKTRVLDELAKIPAGLAAIERRKTALAAASEPKPTAPPTANAMDGAPATSPAS